MNKVIPKIFNNSLQLILSETLCCNPNHGVQVHIPITTEKSMELHFIFQSDSDKSKRSITTSQKENVLTFTLTNFLNNLGASFSQPFEFNIGVNKFFLQLYGSSTGESILCLTISIFKGQKNE